MHATEYDTVARNNVELKNIMLCGNKQTKKDIKALGGFHLD